MVICTSFLKKKLLVDSAGATKKHRKDMRETAGTWSRIWSMGRIPEQIISALVETKEGMTRPGQSQRHRPGSTYRVCDTSQEEATKTITL